VNKWPPLWSSGQSSWLQIQRSGFDSPRYQIFWDVVGLQRGPLSLVNTLEELLRRKSSGSGLENREYGRKGSVKLSTWHKMAPTSLTSSGRSVGIVRSRIQATELGYLYQCIISMRLNIIRGTFVRHSRHSHIIVLTRKHTEPDDPRLLPCFLFYTCTLLSLR
jgi:hypothetical protein